MRDDASNLLLGDYLRIGPEPGASVQVVGPVRARICRDITIAQYAQEVHRAQRVHYLICREVLHDTVDHPFQVLVDEQCIKAVDACLLVYLFLILEREDYYDALLKGLPGEHRRGVPTLLEEQVSYL